MSASRGIVLPLLLGVALVTQGCLVPKSRYDKLKAEHDRLAKLIEERESELASAQDSFRKRLEDTTKELDLYKKQATMSQADAEKLRKALEDAQKQGKDLESKLKALGIGEVRDGRLIMQAALLFALGEDTLSMQGQHALDKVAGAFKGHDVLIEIDGHTDNTPIAKPKTKTLHRDNMGLSAHRALAVYRYLASKGIPERKMYIRAFGESWPVASNATETAKTKNRRVEIRFTPSSIEQRPAPSK